MIRLTLVPSAEARGKRMRRIEVMMRRKIGTLKTKLFSIQDFTENPEEIEQQLLHLLAKVHMYCVVFVVAKPVKVKLKRLHLSLFLVADRRRMKEKLEHRFQSLRLVRIIPYAT